MELSNSSSSLPNLTQSTFGNFRAYALSEETAVPARLAQRRPREVCDFVADRLREGDIPLPRVIEAQFGKEGWAVVKDLVRRLDVEPALWVVAAGKFYDDPMTALRTIAQVVSAQHVPQLEELGRAFFDRSQEFFVKRCGIQGTVVGALIPSAHIDDLFVGETEHSGNTGRASATPGESDMSGDSTEEESDPFPGRWNGKNLWDNVIRAQEDSEKE